MLTEGTPPPPHPHSFAPPTHPPLPISCTGQDWMRLVRARGIPPVPRSIPLSEIAKHCTKDDAWMAINGRVYDVSPYMDFHPGGVPELVRGAGKDATALFNSFHPWYAARALVRGRGGGVAALQA